MKEQLIEYGFKEKDSGWLTLDKTGWQFDYNPFDNYVWLYPPECADDHGIVLQDLTYEKLIALIEFISDINSTLQLILFARAFFHRLSFGHPISSSRELSQSENIHPQPSCVLSELPKIHSSRSHNSGDWWRF